MHYKDYLIQSENTTAKKAILFDTKPERRRERWKEEREEEGRKIKI